MTGKIDISPEQLAIVQGVLKAHLPKGTLAWAFGSRVTWTAKPFSDLDIALEGAAPLAPDVLIDLEEAFEASDLPWKVDVIDLNTVSPEFRAIVERQRVRFPTAVLRLGDHSQKIGSGATPRGGKDSYLAQGPYSLIRSQNVHNHGFEFGGLAYIDEDQARKLQNVEVLEGDVLVNITGDSVARVCMVHPSALPARVNQHVAIVRPDPSVIDPFFLRYWLVQRSSQAHLLGLAAAGATRNALTKSMLEGLEIPYVEIDIQRRVGAALRLLDDKIELNRRMNETLEAMARAVFRDWFVDFGPTRRKAAGLTDPAAILGGLLPDPIQATTLAAIFPDGFADNGLPEGWEERPIGSFLQDVIGGDWGKETPVGEEDEAVAILRGTDFPDIRNGGMGKVPTRYSTSKKVARRTLQPFDIIVEVSGGSPTQPTGRSIIVTQDILKRFSVPIVPASFCRRFRPSSKHDAVLLHTHLSDLYDSGGTWKYQNQSTGISNFQTTHFLEAEMVVFPGLEVMQEFSAIVDPMIELANTNENQTLAATRDLLLPKLMSGEIRLIGVEGVA